MPAFHELSFVAEGDEVVVGRVDTGAFAVLPHDGAELLRRLSEGMSLESAAQWYEDTYEEAVDVEEFVEGLDDLGFVRSADGPAVVAVRLRFRRLAEALFSPVTGVVCLALVAWWAGLLLLHPALRPRSSQIFFTHSLLLVQLVIAFGQVPLLFLHEGAHILAGQRLGLAGRLNISNRLTYIVFETQLNGLLSVPRRQRYLPFLAGMITDVVVLSVLGVIAETTRGHGGALSLVAGVCLCLAFTVVMRIAWQFQLYLRTDLYFVFATALNCFDLHDASKALLKNRIWRLLNQPRRLVDEYQWTEHDRRVGRWYGPFLVIGIATTVGIFAFASVPIVTQYLSTTGHEMAAGPGHVHFWDAAFSLCFNVAQLVALFFLSRRKKRQASARAPRLLAG